MSYYDDVALNHEELQSVIKRSNIMICMPNQHTALMRSYDDLRRAAESLDMAIIHFANEKQVDEERVKKAEAAVLAGLSG
jgi:hypothetical protein